VFELFQNAWRIDTCVSLGQMFYFCVQEELAHLQQRVCFPRNHVLFCKRYWKLYGYSHTKSYSL